MMIGGRNRVMLINTMMVEDTKVRREMKGIEMIGNHLEIQGR